MCGQQIWGLCQRSDSLNLVKRLSHRSMATPSQVNVLAQGHKITPFKRPQSTMTRILPLVEGQWSSPWSNEQKVLLFLLLLLLDKPGLMVISWFWTVGMFHNLAHSSLQKFVVLATSSVVILSCTFLILQGVQLFYDDGTSWPHLIVILDLWECSSSLCEILSSFHQLLQSSNLPGHFSGL